MTKYPFLSVNFRWERVLPYVMILAAVVGIAASLVLSYDKMQVLADKNFQPECNINPVISCGSVMTTSQAEIAGIPNTFFGLIAFAALGAVAVALATGARFSKIFWKIMHVASAAGVGFMLYLFFQSVFRIHAICPWCFFVWLVIFPVFLGISVYTVREDVYQEPRSRFLRFIWMAVDRYAANILVLWYVAMLGILLIKFWYYWSTLL